MSNLANETLEAQIERKLSMFGPPYRPTLIERLQDVDWTEIAFGFAALSFGIFMLALSYRIIFG